MENKNLGHALSINQIIVKTILDIRIILEAQFKQNIAKQ